MKKAYSAAHGAYRVSVALPRSIRSDTTLPGWFPAFAGMTMQDWEAQLSRSPVSRFSFCNAIGFFFWKRGRF